MDIENFIPTRNLDVLRRVGLHKIAGAMNGVDEMTLKEAFAVIAAKAHLKRAEHRDIMAGLESLSVLRGEKEANTMDLMGPLLLKALPAAAIGGAGAYMASPNDPDAELSNFGMGAGLGGIAGLLRGLHIGSQRDPQSASALGAAICRRV